MSVVQYRVRWQREGFPPKSKSYGNNRARAEAMALFLQGRVEEATGHARDDFKCCDGRECGCGGVTWGESWDARLAKIGEVPPLLFARIETRKVERWEALDDE